MIELPQFYCESIKVRHAVLNAEGLNVEELEQQGYTIQLFRHHVRIWKGPAVDRVYRWPNAQAKREYRHRCWYRWINNIVP